MAADKLPAIQFYPADWKKDPAVQSLDLEHRGAWIEILLLAHETSERGRLVLPNGAPIPDKSIAKMLGVTEQKWKQIRKQLLSMGVASEDERGVLYNRRMVRDSELRRKRAEAGRIGGSKAKRKQNGSKEESKPQGRARGPAGASSSASATTNDSSLRSESAARVPVEVAGPGAGVNGSVNGHVSASQLLGAWIDRQPVRPPDTVIAKQHRVATRLVGTADREQLARAWVGIERIFPYSRGDPWDLFDLERHFAKAMASAEDEPELKRARRMQELMAELDEAG